MTRHRLIRSVTGAATLAAALGLLGGACAADGGGASGQRAPGSRHEAPTRQVPTLALTRPAEPEGPALRGNVQAGPAIDRMAAASGGRAAAARAPIDVTVYYLHPAGGSRYLAPEQHEVPFASSATGVAASAVTELLAGTPRHLDSARPFPSGTRLLGLGLDGGTATVNLSREALGTTGGDGYALQALVWTATQVPRVKRVVVQVEGRSDGFLDGQPLAGLLGIGTGDRELVRDRAARVAPILLAEPAWRDAVEGDRVVAKGRARVAGGTVGLRLRDPSGRVVSQGYAALPSDAPGWATFSGALTFLPPLEPQLWTVEAFETSATDGSVTYSVSVAVWVGR